jgi:phosphatidylglycerophosphatase A
MSSSKRTWKFLLSGFGTGWLPLAPGTWGAALATLMLLPLPYVAPPHATLMLTVAILVFTWIGVIGSAQVADEWGDDPRQTVIDEMVGLWITLLGLPLGWPWLLGGFLLFRFFDIVKPLGIRQVERLEGGWGIMLDDILAGVYGNLVLQIVFLTVS